mgnify:CR=1 FL=1
MGAIIKTADEIQKMRVAGKLAAEVLNMIGEHVVKGVTTDELNQLCHNYIVDVQAGIPAPLNYGHPPFPKSICTSVNHVICHGIPSDKKLKDGDIVNIDVTVIKDGYHGDSSKMFVVGKPSIMAERLIRVTQECLYKAIEIVKPGTTLGDIGHVIQHAAIEHLCNLKIDHHILGDISFSEDKKEFNISSFKEGFSNNIVSNYHGILD